MEMIGREETLSAEIAQVAGGRGRRTREDEDGLLIKFSMDLDKGLASSHGTLYQLLHNAFSRVRAATRKGDLVQEPDDEAVAVVR